MSDADFLIIGSGPAGVSVAMPLVAAGRKVLMLDGALGTERGPVTPAERMLGLDLEGLRVDDGLSPKLRGPEARRAIAGFARANRVRGENFAVIGSLARGGLSRVWGAFAAEFSSADMDGWPIPHADLAASYARVSRRMGISGSTTDAAGQVLGASGPLMPPLPLGAASRLVLERYGRKSGGTLALGHARNAILSAGLHGRPACDLRKDCLWGCPIGAIYNSRQDIAQLAAHANFRLENGAVVEAVEQEGAGWRARTAEGRTFSASRILLAAGTLGSSRLVARLLPPLKDWMLLSNPVIATPLFVPAALLSKPSPGHSLAQLSYFLPFGAGAQDYVSGAIYETDSLPPSTFVNQLPLGRRAGQALFRAIAPGLLIAATSFAGTFSRNRLFFNSATGSLTVQGGFTDDLRAVADRVAHRLAAAWRALGVFMLPGGKLAMPGTDAHFAATLPMGGTGANSTDGLGALASHPGLHIVDGSILPSLPPRHATLTIMANADRIGTALTTA